MPYVGSPVDHRPFVQAETAELGLSICRRREQTANPPDAVGTPYNLRRIHGGGAVDIGVAAASVVLLGFEQPDAGAGVPDAELVRPGGVVGEEEVLDRVWFAAVPALEVVGDERVDATTMGGLVGRPLRRAQCGGHRSRAKAYRSTPGIGDQSRSGRRVRPRRS